MMDLGAGNLPEICGQLIIGGYDSQLPSPSFLQALKEKQRAGAILFRRNLPDYRVGLEASNMLRDAAKDDLCPFVAIDQEGGRVARLGAPLLRIPTMQHLATFNDVGFVQTIAYSVNHQLLSIGFNVNFAPVLDVNTNSANPVIGDRSFSSDPMIVAEMGAAWIRGSQQAGVCACGKHFPGHGDTSVDSHFDLPVINTSLQHLASIELVPFQRAINAGVDAIMTAHIIVSSVCANMPATLCEQIVSKMLRNDMNFQGVIVSDDLEMKAISERFSIEHAAVQAVNAGCDALLICKHESLQHQAHEALVHQAEKDPHFRYLCEQSALRCRTLRARRCIPSSSIAYIEQTFERYRSLQQQLNESLAG